MNSQQQDMHSSQQFPPSFAKRSSLTKSELNFFQNSQQQQAGFGFPNLQLNQQKIQKLQGIEQKYYYNDVFHTKRSFSNSHRSIPKDDFHTEQQSYTFFNPPNNDKIIKLQDQATQYLNEKQNSQQSSHVTPFELAPQTTFSPPNEPMSDNNLNLIPHIDIRHQSPEEQKPIKK